MLIFMNSVREYISHEHHMENNFNIAISKDLNVKHAVWIYGRVGHG